MDQICIKLNQVDLFNSVSEIQLTWFTQSIWANFEIFANLKLHQIAIFVNLTSQFTQFSKTDLHEQICKNRLIHPIYIDLPQSNCSINDRGIKHTH